MAARIAELLSTCQQEMAGVVSMLNLNAESRATKTQANTRSAAEDLAGDSQL